MQLPIISPKRFKKPWRSFTCVPLALHQRGVSFNDSFEFSLSFWCDSSGCVVLSRLRCFPVKGVAAKFSASLVLFHPFPGDAAGCSSRASRHNLLHELPARCWASAPFTSARELKP